MEDLGLLHFILTLTSLTFPSLVLSETRVIPLLPLNFSSSTKGPVLSSLLKESIRSLDELENLTFSSSEGRVPFPILSSRGYESEEHEHEQDYPVLHSSYATHGSYNPLAIIALAVFGLLATIVFLQLLGVSTFRSLGSSVFSLPYALELEEDLIPQVMIKLAEYIERSDWMTGMAPGVAESGRRTVREISGGLTFQQPSISEWLRAFKKDPYTYECVRKLACETLANSTIVSASFKSKSGIFLLSLLEKVTDYGPIIVDQVRDIIELPERCAYIAPDPEHLCKRQDFLPRT